MSAPASSWHPLPLRNREERRLDRRAFCGSASPVPVSLRLLRAHRLAELLQSPDRWRSPEIDRSGGVPSPALLQGINATRCGHKRQRRRQFRPGECRQQPEDDRGSGERNKRSARGAKRWTGCGDTPGAKPKQPETTNQIQHQRPGRAQNNQVPERSRHRDQCAHEGIHADRDRRCLETWMHSRGVSRNRFRHAPGEARASPTSTGARTR
jgi:hypothetical protein